jgi:hypothetical protein
MPKILKDFVGYQVNDLVTLSDLQTQAEYSKMTVDFPIREVRTYREPNGVFAYYGYIIEAPNASRDRYLVLVKTMKDMFEIYIFFKDAGISGLLNETSPLLVLFDEAKKDFIPRFEAQVTDQSSTHPVTWDKQTSSYGVEFESTVDPSGICSLGEYYTGDENGGNNYCLLDWKGDTAKGFIETWYGCRIQNTEIAMFHK